MDHSDYDEGLWDELNHQQSREIEQHYFQRNQASRWTFSSALQRLPPPSAVGAAFREKARQIASAVVQGIGGNPNLTNSIDGGNDSNESHPYDSLSSLLPPPSAEEDNDFGINSFGTRQQQQQSRREPMLQQRTLESIPPAPHGHDNDQTNNTGNNNNIGNAYVFLQPFRLLPRNEGWGAVADLDVFFTSLYQYYYHRGFTTFAMEGLVELITLFFTLGLSIFLFACLDWSALSSCTEEATCHAKFSDYIIRNPFSHKNNTSVSWKVWIFLYSVIFFLYGSFSVWSWWHALQQARASKLFMEEQLGIGESKLQSGAVDWDVHVVSKIQHLQTSGQYRIAIHGQADDTLDALLIAQRILRKENFMVALFNNPALFDWSLPFCSGFVCFSKTMEWTIYFCILNFMFNHKYQLRPAFYLDPNSLKRRLFVCGVGHIFFMPFLLFFMTLYFSLQNAYDWKSTKNYLGPREWSLAAKWTLREFNELPHLFEKRMEPSYEAAEKYIKLFRQNEIVTSVGRVLVFTGGSLGAVLFAFAAINDAILLHVKIADWNLLWYAGVVAAIYSVGKTMLPSQEKVSTTRPRHTNLSQEIDLALEEVAKHTHHFPDIWKGRGWDKRTTFKSFTKMYKYKAHLFVQELVSIVVAPYILCVTLPRCAERICDFVFATRAEVPGAGDVCGYCTFDFDIYGDELWEGKTIGRSGFQQQSQVAHGDHQQNGPTMLTGSLSESIMQSGTVMESTQQFPIPRAYLGKMEKSFFSFKANHPSWKCSQSGQDLVCRVEKYQEEQNIALVRERQLHIEAAARQMEILAQLEQVRHHNSGHGPLGAGGLVVDSATMDEAYIATQIQTAADAVPGAGPDLQRIRQPPQRIAAVDEEYSLAQNDASATLPFATPGNHHGHNREEPPPPPPFASSISQKSIEAQQVVASSSRTNRHSTIASDSLNGVAPPLSKFPRRAPSHRLSSNAAVASTTSQSLALSSDLRRILNMSTLDPDVDSVWAEIATGLNNRASINLTRSMAGLPTDEGDRERVAERHLYWLDRFHAHNVIASRQSQSQVHPPPPPSVLHTPPLMSASVSAGTSLLHHNGSPAAARSFSQYSRNSQNSSRGDSRFGESSVV